MTGRHRLPILALVPLLFGACDSSTPTNVPTSSSSPSPSAESASAPPIGPIATPFPSPDSTCGPLDPNSWTPSADFDVGLPLGYSFLGLDVTHVSSNLTPDPGIDFEGGEPYLDDPIRLVGGWQISLIPAVDDDNVEDVPISLLDARAILRIGQHDPVLLEGSVGVDPRSERPAFLFEVPDVKGQAVVEFTVRWSDPCYTYEATGGWAFELVRAAFAARCPSDHEGFAAYWEALADPPFLVGDVPVDLHSIETLGLWTRYAVSSQGDDGLGSWDASAGWAQSVVGGVLRAADANPDLELAFLAAEFYRRKAVLNWLDGGARPNRVFRATAEPYPDGHFDLLVPNDPGRYVASIHVQWESPCASGGAVGAVGIDVE